METDNPCLHRYSRSLHACPKAGYNSTDDEVWDMERGRLQNGTNENEHHGGPNCVATTKSLSQEEIY